MNTDPPGVVRKIRSKMKKLLIVTGIISLSIAMISCNDVRRSPGRAYMPDMTDSRAYETYAPAAERLKNSSAPGATYTGQPVPGTIARGEMFPYTLKNDSAGYELSASVKNPLPALNAKQYLEAARLYQINCGICHGTNLDGNGPLFKGGDGPYSAKPVTLVGDPVYEAMPEGRMFHVATYGKGQMGSYASQLTTEQRWMIVHYIKEKQSLKAAGAGGAGAKSDTTSTGASGVQGGTNVSGDTASARN